MVTRLALGIILSFGLLRAGSAADAGIKHRLMFFEYGNCPNRFVELDADGRIVHEFKPRSIAVMFQILPNGNIVYGYGGHPTGVVEVNPRGETVWNYVSKCPQVLGCERLANGNTLVNLTHSNMSVEVDPSGKIVWQLTNADLPSPLLKDPCGAQRLPNGNTVITSYGAGDQTVKMLEVTPEKKVVWTFEREKKGGIHEFQILDTNGQPLEGEPLK